MRGPGTGPRRVWAAPTVFGCEGGRASRGTASTNKRYEIVRVLADKNKQIMFKRQTKG